MSKLILVAEKNYECGCRSEITKIEGEDREHKMFYPCDWHAAIDEYPGE